MKIVEILDSVGVDSFNIESWINECVNFKIWYCKLGTQEINEIELEKAFLKIEHNQKTNSNAHNSNNKY